MNRRIFLQSVLAAPLAAVIMPSSFAPTFVHGSRGILDFGTGSLATLHGKEAVVSAGQLRVQLRANTQQYEAAMRQAAASLKQLQDRP